MANTGNRTHFEFIESEYSIMDGIIVPLQGIRVTYKRMAEFVFHLGVGFVLITL